MRFLGGSRKTNIEWGFPEKGGGGLGQFTDLEGRSWQERGGGVFEGGADTPMHNKDKKCQFVKVKKISVF